MPKTKTKSSGINLKPKLFFNKTLLIVTAVVVVITGGYVYYKSTHAAGGCVFFTIGYGATGRCVSDIQGMLNWDLNGTSSGNYIRVDGAYGTQTKNAVTLFQAIHGIKHDGIVGSQTWGGLCHDFKPIPPNWWYLYAFDAGCFSNQGN